MVTGQDFCTVTPKVWDILCGWYGGGPAIRRRAISGRGGQAELELHWLELKIFLSMNPDAAPRFVNESKVTTVRSFKWRLCSEFGLDEADTILASQWTAAASDVVADIMFNVFTI